jgi:hypothetical protein
LTLAATVDGSGRTLSPGQVRDIYGDPAGLKITEQGMWNLQSLEGL